MKKRGCFSGGMKKLYCSFPCLLTQKIFTPFRVCLTNLLFNAEVKETF